MYPAKVIKGKLSLPWISRDIKRLIHKGNKFYKSHRKTGKSQLREKYISLRHAIRKKTKDSHEVYIEGLLDMDRQNNQAIGQGNSKKKTLPVSERKPLRQNGNLHPETTQKANILNQQFQSVFTPLAPLSLKELSLMKVQDIVDNKFISPGNLHEDEKHSTPLMPDIKIPESGIVNQNN